MMTFNEMYSRVLEIFPDAECGEDNEGQLVIYTGMKEQVLEDNTSVVVEMQHEAR